MIYVLGKLFFQKALIQSTKNTFQTKLKTDLTHTMNVIHVTKQNFCLSEFVVLCLPRHCEQLRFLSAFAKFMFKAIRKLAHSNIQKIPLSFFIIKCNKRFATGVFSKVLNYLTLFKRDSTVFANRLHVKGELSNEHAHLVRKWVMPPTVSQKKRGL